MRFYLHYALRALRRGGQRTLLAIVSVVFGVMALVAMQLLSSVIGEALLGDPRMMHGGDLSIDHVTADTYLSAADLDQLATLQDSGRIEAYTLISRGFNMLIKPENGTRTEFVMYAMGVEPDVYPLVGSVTMRAPEGVNLAAAIRKPGTIAVTRDMAADLALEIGDVIRVTDGMGGAPQALVIGGIIEMLPDHMAKSVLYSLETAGQITNNSQAITGAHLIAPDDPAGLASELRATGWRVMEAGDFSQSEKEVRDIFDFGLKGAGMLALLVGGIGVSNTMQVILARRTTEIAVLKTLGYRQRHLLLMFGLETLLIGIAGSGVGTIAALLLAHPLMRSMESTGIFLLEWEITPGAMISGALAGIATTLIFGFYAIIRASAVRPAVLLRQFSTARAWQRWLASVGVYAVLALPFSVVSSFIMGSIAEGLGVIALALAGFLGLGLIMGSALWITTRIPLPHSSMLTLARNNLRRQSLRLVFALIALFIGVVAIGFSVAVTRAASEEFNEQLGSLEGTNLILFGSMQEEAAIQAQIDTLDGVKTMNVRYPAELAALEVQIDGTWQPLQINWLDGRLYDQPAWGLELTGEAWGSRADGVYLPAPLQGMVDGLQPGSTLRLRGTSGAAREMVLSGFYRTLNEAYMGIMPESVIASRDVVAALSDQQATVIYEGELYVDQLETASQTLNTALPDVMALNAGDVRAVVQGILFSLLSFVITVAGFALVAGAVLIANAVGLAMVERRREIGVMKAVGYTGSHVLTTLVLEHAQLGLLAGLLGTAAVAAVCYLLRVIRADIVLSLDVPSGLAIILVCVGLATASVMSVAWRPAHVAPLVVLRDE
ncbi:MAG: FtsX-like permease family protein [Anaerolineae bacterium]|nr:FtsX-like permease family protein [Anaerolineae bacterium]